MLINLNKLNRQLNLMSTGKTITNARKAEKILIFSELSGFISEQLHTSNMSFFLCFAFHQHQWKKEQQHRSLVSAYCSNRSIIWFNVDGYKPVSTWLVWSKQNTRDMFLCGVFVGPKTSIFGISFIFSSLVYQFECLYNTR